MSDIIEQAAHDLAIATMRSTMNIILSYMDHKQEAVVSKAEVLVLVESAINELDARHQKHLQK